jgi:DNA-directed RNA polymerase specialized sigma24 family protein
MTAQDLLPLPPDDGPELHRRLCEGDPVAPSDLARAYFTPLIAWLGRTNPRVAPEYCADAAGQAIMDLIRKPSSYNPGRQELAAYLRMAATGDLRNLLRREGRHRRRRRDLGSVELFAGP